MVLKHPILIAVFGLPGTGKTTFASFLASHLGIKHYNTDIIRSFRGKSHKYDHQNKILIYNEMLRLTRLELDRGKSAIVDATFYKRELREKFKLLAKEFGFIVKWIEVCAEAESVKKRISKKRMYSEADYPVYQKIKEQFDPMEEEYLQVFTDREEFPDLIDRVIKFLEQ